MKSVIDVGQTVIKTLDQMGVTLKDIDPDKEEVVFYVALSKSRLLQSVEETLKSVYGILWTLVHGKITDKNRNEKIDLEYEVVEGDTK